jgi:hypothetical protein
VSEYVRITDRKIELTDEGVEALMGDHTPTTEQVRKGLLTGYVSDSEFDRWLAEVKAQAFDLGAASQRCAYPKNPYRGENK